MTSWPVIPEAAEPLSGTQGTAYAPAEQERRPARVLPWVPDKRCALSGMTDQEAESALAGMMVTLSPQPQASVSLGLRKTNLEARRVVS